MALINNITPQKLERDVLHKSVECTFDVVTNSNGEKFLQLDTYSATEGKKSQSLRLSPSAIKQLKEILQTFHL